MDRDLLPFRSSLSAYATLWLEFPDLTAPEIIFEPVAANSVEELGHWIIAAVEEHADTLGNDVPGFLEAMQPHFEMLAAAPINFWVRGQDADSVEYRALVATDGQRAIRCVIYGEQVTIEQVNPVMMAIIEVTPEIPAADFRSASAPLREVIGTDRDLDSVLVQVRKKTSPDVHFLRELMSTNPVAKAQFEVAVRSRTGKLHVNPMTVNFVDLETGRVLFFVEGEHLTALPGNDDNIATLLDRSAKELD